MTQDMTKENKPFALGNSPVDIELSSLSFKENIEANSIVLNLETIDPSDSMRNFVHNMNFSKTKGFSVIEKVELEK